VAHLRRGAEGDSVKRNVRGQQFGKVGEVRDAVDAGAAAGHGRQFEAGVLLDGRQVLVAGDLAQADDGDADGHLDGHLTMVRAAPRDLCKISQTNNALPAPVKQDRENERRTPRAKERVAVAKARSSFCARPRRAMVLHIPRWANDVVDSATTRPRLECERYHWRSDVFSALAIGSQDLEAM
jgi:hypothetical protein